MITSDFAASETPLNDIEPPARYARTPHRIFRSAVAIARIAEVAAVRDALSGSRIELVSGYSFKTNPRPEMVDAAREHDFFAETISRDEVAWALERGFAADRIVYNGPEPLLDRVTGSRIGVAFADSVEALIRNVRRRVARLHGVRLRPSMIASRFGIAIEEDETLAAVAAALEPRAPLAVSFHARRGDFKGAGWRDVAGDVLERAAALQAAARRPVVCFDIGGGWKPDEFDDRFASDAAWLLERLEAALPECTRLIFEPGQAVCTPSEAILCEVLEVRERRSRRDAVIDAGYPDWPEMHEYAHGLFVWRAGAWRAVGRGPDRLLGRTCLEYDMIEGLRLPANLERGERILIADTGSYDHSMAFCFARGGASVPLH